MATTPKTNPFEELDKEDPFTEAEGLFDKAASSFEKVTEYEGRLLMATYVSTSEEIDTDFGKATPVSANVVVLDGDEAPKELGEILIFQKVLIGQLKGKTRPILGVLTKRPAKKKGMSPAWVLDSDAVTPEQIKVAKEYLLSQQAVDKA